MGEEVDYHSVEKMKSNYMKMNNMRRAQMLCDLKIKIGSKIFFVHKIVLASSSEYFNMMFTENFIESKKDEITMDELSPDIFEILIDYMYTLNIKITENNVLDLLVASNYLLFFDIYDACKDFMKKITNIENCLSFQSFAQTHDVIELQELCLQFILVNFIEIAKSGDFLLLSFEQIKEIIQNDQLNANEEKIYEAIILWVNHNVKNRSKLLPELFQVVRLPLIPLKYLIENISEQKFISSNSKCLEILDNAIKIQYCIRDGIKNQPHSICNYKPRGPQTPQVLIILHCNNSSTSTLQWYNVFKKCIHLTTLTWKELHYTSIILNNGRIMYLEQNPEWTKTFAKIYNGELKQWESTSFSHYFHKIINSVSSVKMIQFENHVYVFSRNSVEYYDILNKSWHIVNFQVSTNINNTQLAVASNRIYIISNQKCFYYNPKIGVSQTIKPILFGFRNDGFTLCSLNNQLYVIHNNSGEAEKYDSGTNTWIPIAKMNKTRHSPGAIAINGLIYVFGGGNSDSIEYYDPQLNQWSYCVEKIILPSNVSCYDARAFVLGVESNIHQANILNYYSKSCT